jgi:hypothetical protein
MNDNDRKPLGRKSYGTIPHLLGSRIGIGDYHISEHQGNIATLKTRDRHDEVIVQEKLDGSNVGICKVNGQILAITRAGYLANTSPYIQHHYWSDWVEANKSRFDYVLNEGERLCGEWLAQAHGTRYKLPHEPLVVFDLMIADQRLPYDEFIYRIGKGNFILPHVLHRGQAFPVGSALRELGQYGYHGALDQVEGAVWRVETNRIIDKQGTRKRVVDFLVKYVRPDKTDGIYLPEVSKQEIVWNWLP